jgi:Ca2+-binding RTX toxin-like protein
MRIAHGAKVLAVVPLLVLGSVVGAPTAAWAADGKVFVDSGPQLISFTAASGETNDLVVRQTVITLDSGLYATQYVFDDTQPITPGAECTRPNASDDTRAVCILVDSRDPAPVLRVRLGDGNDRLRLAFEMGTATVFGGVGNDVLRTSGGVLVNGDAGADVVTGYYCKGGDGADRLVGCHVAEGGAGNDSISGTAKGDELRGGPGKDVITGGAGNDLIWGNSGDDALYGNSGNDTIRGGPGKDTISGGPGADKITQ